MSGSDEGVNKEDIKAANDLVNEANGSPGVSQLLFPLRSSRGFKYNRIIHDKSDYKHFKISVIYISKSIISIIPKSFLYNKKKR